MKRFLIFVICFSPSLIFAAEPTISNVSGTVATGQTLTITGTNLLQENKTSWVDLTGGSPNALFKTGTTYGFEGTISGDGWRNVGNQNGAYDSSTYLAGAQSMRFNVSGGTANGGAGTAFSSSASGDYWFRYYVQYSGSVSTWPTDHMKMFGVATNNGMCYFQFAMNAGAVPVQFVATCGQASSTAYGSVPSGSIAMGHWYLVEEQMNNSGTLNVWVDGTQVITNYTYASYSWFDFLQPGPINVGSFTGSFSNYFDNLTVATARPYASSYIEISGNGGTTWTYQSPILLSETSIAITAALPTLTAANYIVRVTNNGQLVAAAGNLSTAGGVTYNLGGDSTPVISNPLPSGTLSYGTTSTAMQVTTDESATCKYGTADASYASLPNTFNTTGGTAHSQTISGLTNGSAYTFYVRCIDGSSNADTTSTAISFSVANAGSNGSAGVCRANIRCTLR